MSTLREKETEVIITELEKSNLFNDLKVEYICSRSDVLVKEIIKIVLPDLDFDTMISQKPYTNPGGRGIRLDVYIEDFYGNGYDIEIQRRTDGFPPRRARCNLSLMDTELFKGDSKNWENLRNSCEIVIFEGKPFKDSNYPLYLIERKSTGLKLDGNGFVDSKHDCGKFNDGQTIYYVNGSYLGNDDLGDLVRDMHEVDPSKMRNRNLKEGVQILMKTVEREFKIMSEEEIQKYFSMTEEERDREKDRERAIGMIKGCRDIGIPYEGIKVLLKSTFQEGEQFYGLLDNSEEDLMHSFEKEDK
jgi:hypothetical protein